MARSQTATAYATSAGNAAQYIAANKPISDMLKAVLTQTTDTGQVAWSGTGVVTTLPNPQTIRDFEIYRFNDALQSTSPVFLRLDYIYNVNTNATAQHRVTAGTGTDGAGNLVNPTPTVSFNLTTANVGGLTAYASNGDGSLMNAMLGLTPATTAVDLQFCAFTLERFRNADGTPSGEGFNLYVWSTTGLTAGQFFTRNISRNNIASPALVTETQLPCVIPAPSGPTTAFTGSTATAFPFYTWGPNVRGASAAVLYGYQGDWPRDSEVSITHYGKTMKFLAIGNSALMAQIFNAGTTVTTGASTLAFSPLFRWE